MLFDSQVNCIESDDRNLALTVKYDNEENALFQFDDFHHGFLKMITPISLVYDNMTGKLPLGIFPDAKLTIWEH